MDDCNCCWYQTFGLRAIILRYGTYKMRKRLEVNNIGKLMDGFVVHAERYLAVLGGFWFTHLIGLYLGL